MSGTGNAETWFVGEQDTVIAALDNNIDALDCRLPVSTLCAVNVPFQSPFRGAFLRHQIADADTYLLVCDESYLERVAADAGLHNALKLVLHRDTVETAIDCAV